MQTLATILTLDAHAERALKARLMGLPPAMLAVFEWVQPMVQGLLKTFWEHLDNQLFELADSAGPTADQVAYFSAMRELRLQKRGVERRFFLQLEAGFVALDGAAPLLQKISLVPPEAPELRTAVEWMLAQAHHTHADPLAHIGQRLSALVPTKVYAKNNPIGPDALCESLDAACADLHFSPKVLLAVYQQFDADVLQALTPVYAGTLQQLVAMQVQPVAHWVDPVTPSIPPPLAPAPANPFDAELALLLQDMAMGITPSAPALSVPSLPLASLVEVLSMAQRQSGACAGIADIYSMVEALGGQRGFQGQLSRMDSELLHLVNGLFDSLFNDRNLPSGIKQLLGRLQIPIMKVALVDKAFFTQKGHGARLLLNEFAMAGVSWNGAVDDSLYQHMDALVQRVVLEFDADVSLFMQLWLDFSAFLEREKRRTALFERRLLDMEETLAHTDAVRIKVNAELGLRTQGFLVPQDMAVYIREVWAGVLLAAGLQQGVGGEEWQQHAQTLTDWVWSLQPPVTANDRAALIALVPPLLQRLRKGLDSIAFNPFHTAQFFDALENYHFAALGINQGDKPALESPSAPLKTPVFGAALSPLPSEEPTAPSLGPTDIHWQQVASYTPGVWFDFLEANKPAMRCRLAAVIRSADKFIFVNRSGVKVCERSHAELAMALKQGQLVPLDNNRLFDRALEEVVSSLRKTSRMPWVLDEDPKSD